MAVYGRHEGNDTEKISENGLPHEIWPKKMRHGRVNMHSYLRAIGFSDIKDGSDIKEIIHDVFYEYDKRNATREDKSRAFVEYSKEFGTGMGITVCGSLDREGFHQEYYFPYLKGNGITTEEDLVIEKRGESESFCGVCDDMRVGVSLIFYLQNAAEYKKESILGKLLNQKISTTFSALSLQGKILFPVLKNEEQIRSNREAERKRSRLIAEARKGDEAAIESLTLEDIDMYTMISRRVQNEDIFSIVETYFMPYGMECDQYHILGEIRSVQKVKNEYTNEKVWQMDLECNDMHFVVCINAKDLIGDPEVGRRFKGSVWLQGCVNFS